MTVEFSDFFYTPKWLFRSAGFLPFIQSRPFDVEQAILLIFTVNAIICGIIQHFLLIANTNPSFVEITNTVSVSTGCMVPVFKAMNCWNNRVELRKLLRELQEMFPVEDKTPKWS